MAHRKRQRVLVVGDFNVAMDSCPGHFSVNPGPEAKNQSRAAVSVGRRFGLSPLDRRGRARPAHPASFSHSTIEWMSPSG